MAFSEGLAAELRNGLLQSLGVAASNDDLCAFGEKLLGSGETNAAVAARNNGDLVLQAIHEQRGKSVLERLFCKDT